MDFLSSAEKKVSYSDYDRIKEQIKDAIDIVELVSRFVPLRRVGRHYVGRCPWHDDSRPSLQVNPERQSYRCWVCNVGGDIFSFIMQMEKVDFKGALEILADMTGIELPKAKRERKETSRERKKTDDPNDELHESEVDDAPQPIDRRTLFNTMDWVQKQYHEALLTLAEAEHARIYLKERGINEQSLRDFRIGYSPLDGSWLMNKVGNQPRRIECLEVAGVLARYKDEEKNTERVYDRFRGRLMFPIRDTQDRTVAFGGRILPNSSLKSSAKYVNSPETPIFSKSKQLYGLDIARLTMQKTKRALIMEGYTDAIMAHQCGVGDAVAILGTALGSEHVKILKRFAEKMVLVLDGDEAGQKRANEVLELFVAQGADLTILTLPAGADPCDFLLEQGKEHFEELLRQQGIDALEHAFRTVTRNVNLEKDIVGSSKALDSLLSLIAAAPTNLGGADDPVQLRLEKTIGRLAQRFQIAETEVRKRLKQWKDRKKNAVDYSVDEEAIPQETYSQSGWAPDALEREMLELWFADPTTFEELDNTIPDDWIQSPLTKKIQSLWRETLLEEPECSFGKILIRFDAPVVKNLLVDMDESASEKGLGPKMDAEKRQQLITQIIQGFSRRDHKRRTNKGLSDLKDESLSKEEKQRMLREMLDSRRQ